MKSKQEETYKQWINHKSVDQETKTELKNISKNKVEISSRFSQDLEFGTGGIRGVMGAGTNRINKYVIRKTTQGFANYLKNEFKKKKDLKVVIAYDSRHNSKIFAQETALVFAANNIKAFLFENIAPTPLLSFSVRELNCIAGIVITASHNPPEYNGYKIYTKDGGQAIPSITKKITESIKKVDIFKDVKILQKNKAIEKGLLCILKDELDNNYLDRVQKLCENKRKKDVKIVYTPLHGTGGRTIPQSIKKCGFRKIFLVKEQTTPDSNFSTVESPNPEEESAFKLALKKAKEVDADIILASDPDADRIGCAIKNSQGEYKLLNGNQIGSLLLNYLIITNTKIPKNSVVIKTIVTGNLGVKIAQDHDIEIEETLTGFKFIGEKINEYNIKKNKIFLFGYEESYGFLAGTFVRDKDATIASTLIVEMASYYKEQGLDLLQALEKLYQKYGYHDEKLVSINLEDSSIVNKILKKFLSSSFRKIGEEKILTKGDYEKGIFLDLDKATKTKILLPKEKTIKFQLANDSWFCIRPSGTEPKLKIYIGTVDSNKIKVRKKIDSLEKNIRAIIEKC